MLTSRDMKVNADWKYDTTHHIPERFKNFATSSSMCVICFFLSPSSSMSYEVVSIVDKI